MEELIKRIQQGNADLMLELWNRLKGLIAWHAKQYIKKNASRGVELDDLIQSGYIALVEAVQAYNPEKGPFNALFPYFLKKQFREAIGIRSSKRNPLNDCVSLDIPAYSNDPDGPARLDFVPDARDYLADVEARVFNDELNAALEAALEGIPAREASVIRSVYYNERSLTETAAELGVSHQRAQQLRNSGLHRLRYGSARSKLEQFVDDRTSFYGGNGLQNYLTAQTSPVEKKVLFRERLREYLVNRGYDAETIQMMTGGNDDGHSA